MVIEEFMAGEEASFFALTDGNRNPSLQLGARITSAWVTAMWGRTPRHGRLFPRTGADAPNCRGRVLRENHRADVRNHARGRQSLFGRCSMRG